MLTLNSTEDEIVAAFKTYGPITVLNQSPEELRQQKKVMQLAVRIEGLALTLASSELKGDKELVIEAIEQSLGWAVFSASAELKIDDDIVELVKHLNAWAYYYLYESPDRYHYFRIPEELEYEVIENIKRAELAILLKYPMWLCRAPFFIRDNTKIVQFLVSKYGLALGSASERLQNNFTVVKTAVTENGKALERASRRLQNNPELLKLAAWNSGINGWFYYGSKLGYLALTKDSTDEATIAIDLSVDEALDSLNNEIKRQKYTLRTGLMTVNDNIRHTIATQDKIGESLRLAVATNEALGHENERLKEQLATTGNKLDATASLLQEKDDELAHLVNALRIVESALTQKDGQLSETVAGLQETKARFDEQLERLDAAQGVIDALAIEKEKALEKVATAERRAELLEIKNKELAESLQAGGSGRKLQISQVLL